jgi:uncharacterized protein (TIGR02246 family)
VNWIKISIISLAPAVAAVLTLSAAQAAPMATISSVRQAIAAGNAKFLRSLENGDAKSFAALFAPDGIELASGDSGITKGRSAIRAAAADGTKITGGNIHTTNVYLDGAVAYETGTYGFDFAVPGKPSRLATGRYFEIWERQPDGSWLIKVDCGYPDKEQR